ncbi:MULTISPECIES: HAD family hydrolase [unclassified Enterococcus]|uniref:HAD family hydrolase n=1 Tax=unclassified Enterococcus TaxID=2608891 RepID=UPI001CE134B9|nr:MULTISPECIES: HAD family phosphatase [unclassified Enterococcus]MCA5013955.1 HAD family phosphatase [Enterococcus sp. S23]MCA5017271.1 HAD family phosphatase [Enterococcus sp. S22(2020)]
MNGIIFDFNGTMFLDSHLHEEAWLHMIKKYSSADLTEDDILLNIHGRTNNEILTHFISNKLNQEQIEQLSYEKEALYREMCLKNPEQLELTAGLTTTLDRLKKAAVPMTIATATTKENLDFYFDIFHLEKWFDPTTVVYDNGTFPGKPAPDIFILAAKKLTLPPTQCLVIEDAFSGLTAAKNAGIGTIIAIDPFEKNGLLFKEAGLDTNGLIKNFENFFETFIARETIV